MSEPIALYGQRPRRRRLYLSLLVAAVLAVVAYRYGPHTLMRCRLLYLQNRIANHVPAVSPAGSKVDDGATFSDPKELVQFYKFFATPSDGSGTGAIAFEGELSNANGSRLVIVRAFPEFKGFYFGRRRVSLFPTIIAPGSWNKNPEFPIYIAAETFGTFDGSSDVDEAKPWLVYLHEGHRDPRDQSAFEFAYTFDGKSGHCRGKLTDDDRVTYEVRENGDKWKSVGDSCLLPSLTAK